MLSKVKEITFYQGNSMICASQLSKGVFTAPSHGGYTTYKGKNIEAALLSGEIQVAEVLSDITEEFKSMLAGEIDNVSSD